MGRIIAFLLVVMAHPALAEQQASAPSEPITEASVAAFTDTYWNHEAKSKTPGFAVAYVKNGQVAFIKGYGVSDLDKKTRVDPEQTQFRIASVSKVFVGIAAAQAISAKLVNPYADINRILSSFSVSDSGLGQLALRNLLTHSGGIDEKYFADSTRAKGQRETLADHLRKRLPPRIRRAGEIMVYSNYGYALAALVLQEATKVDFSELVRRNILQLAGMTKSGFDAIGADGSELATGYMVTDAGGFKKQPYTWVHRYPSTSMLATPADMARFIIALTSETCSPCVLSPTARVLVFKQQMTHNPKMPGRTFGFSEWRRSAENGVWHDGGHAGFAAQLLIFPDSKSGLFIATNAQNSGVDEDFRDAFLNHFYPKQLVLPSPVVETGAPIASFCGKYVSTRRSMTGLERLQGLKDGAIDVECDGNNLTIGERTFSPIGPSLFEANDGSGRFLAFKARSDGTQDYMFVDWGGEPRAFFPQPWIETRKGLTIVFGGGFALMLLPLLVWPVLRLFRAAAIPGLRFEFILAASAMTTLIVFLGSLYFVASSIDPLNFRAGEAGALYVVLALPMVLGGLEAVLAIQLIRHNAVKTFPITATFLMASMFGAVSVLWFLNYANLLGWRL